MKINSIYFSPCGNVKKIIKTMSEVAVSFFGSDVEYIDITSLKNRSNTEIKELNNDSLNFVGLPVFAGRIPNKIMPYIRENIRGNGLFFPFVAFGNRSYDDALFELCTIIKENGGKIIGAMAVPTEHSFTDKLGQYRPDYEDIYKIKDYCGKVLKKIRMNNIENIQNAEINMEDIPGDRSLSKYYTPLGTDGKPAMFLKAYPVTDMSKCVFCHACSRACPMGCIDMENPALISGICIKCHSCIKRCKYNAKSFQDKAFLSHVKMLEKNYQEEKEIEVF